MDEECLSASKRREIEETVLQILKASDLETTTEFGVRAAAAERLGFDLSSLTHRQLVGQLVDSFLQSTAATILGSTSLDRNADGNNNNEKRQQKLSGAGVGLEVNYRGKVICKLSDERRVTIHDVMGTNMVAIRDFYIKDGNMLPKTGFNTGLSLTPKQWSSFKSSFPSIQEAIVKLESRLRRRNAVHPSSNLNCRSEAVPKPSEAEMTNSVMDPAADESQTQAGISHSTSIFHPHIKRKQTETDASRSVAPSNSEQHIVAKIKHEATSDSPVQIPAERKQTKADVATSVTVCPTQGQLNDTVTAVNPEQPVPAERQQTEAEISTSLPAIHAQGQAIRPEQLVPIQTARFDGRNYHSWRHQMEFFLNELNIAYVLAEPCPSISLNPETSSDEMVKVKAAAQRWVDDDYICHHNILNSLCDNLFQFYSQKHYSARELWEELKSAYNEDFGTKRSEINKYIHFQMVDGVSILEQIQELNKIADSIIASGTWIDENFHVSVIVSKLPPSWKEFRVRMMHEEFLPLNKLMHCLHVEEESKKETNYKKGHIIDPKLDYRFGTRRKENKRVCYSCGKEGHIIKYCPDRKFESSKKSNEKEEANTVSQQPF